MSETATTPGDAGVNGTGAAAASTAKNVTLEEPKAITENLDKWVGMAKAEDASHLEPCSEKEWTQWRKVAGRRQGLEDAVERVAEKRIWPRSFDFQHPAPASDGHPAREGRIQASSAFGKHAWSLTIRTERNSQGGEAWLFPKRSEE